MRCPRCRAGALFAGPMRMHPRCPNCGLIFERESGYFTGAMYFSYALMIPVALALTALFWWAIPGHSVLLALALAWIASLPLIPWIFRASRTGWLYLERWLDPGPDGRTAETQRRREE